MHKRSYYIINAITLYRLIAAPVLVFLAIKNQPDLFKWLLAVSFFTDGIDGFLSRRYKVTSILGARLDSIADDATIAAAFAGIFIFKPDFIRQEIAVLGLLMALFILQIALALWRYKKVTSFHTWLAKVATILQGSFLILFFFLPAPLYALFYATAIITALDLLEEILMVLILPTWHTDVKGLSSALKIKKQAGRK